MKECQLSIKESQNVGAFVIWNAFSASAPTWFHCVQIMQSYQKVLLDNKPWQQNFPLEEIRNHPGKWLTLETLRLAPSSSKESQENPSIVYHPSQIQLWLLRKVKNSVSATVITTINHRYEWGAGESHHRCPTIPSLESRVAWFWQAYDNAKPPADDDHGHSLWTTFTRW